jgi:protein-L-isoaspartate(D-aspartate) O-methyltransferase
MDKAHLELMARIDEETRLTASATGRRRLSEAVRAAMAAVPREAFVRPADRAAAYRDRPLPIGHGQTISQPFLVALMAELLDPEPSDVMLEIGTGSGYAAAVLAEIVATVHTVEVVPALAAEARERLAALGYDNVVVHEGDGNGGWPAAAPYDGIVATAAAPAVPAALVHQLAPGGRMVLPVGPPGGSQDLFVLEKDRSGAVQRRAVLPVAFVPLVTQSDR